MPTPGKNFPGQKGFPTPNSTPDETVRRIFIVPNSEEWLGLLEGAVQVLLDEWRFYDWGAMTPAEAVSAFNSIVLASYTNVCQCTLPDGSNVIRLNPSTGAVEELGEDGEWGAPTGDYAIPPVPPRESDPECLAAANCANVLAQLYENLSDSWNSELDEVEALTAFVLALIALVGAEFAPITFALVTFFAWFFSVLYSTLEFVGADLWDENFTAALVCILVGCAQNDAGVITFDYACFNNQLAAQTNVFDLTFEQLRLFGQIQFMLSVIGGADALNQAGATTAITVYDCSDCAEDDCGGQYDFTVGDQLGWALNTFPGLVYDGGTWDGDGWTATFNAGNGQYDLTLLKNCALPSITSIGLQTTCSADDGLLYIFALNEDGTLYSTIEAGHALAAGTDEIAYLTGYSFAPGSAKYLLFAWDVTSAPGTISKISLNEPIA